MDQDDFKTHLEQQADLRAKLIRLIGVRMRQRDGEVKRLRAKADTLLDDWWFHHEGLPKTPENERRAIREVLDYVFKPKDEGGLGEGGLMDGFEQ